MSLSADIEAFNLSGRECDCMLAWYNFFLIAGVSLFIISHLLKNGSHMKQNSNVLFRPNGLIY